MLATLSVLDSFGQVDFYGEPTAGAPPLTVNFYESIGLSGIVQTIHWDFGDGGTSFGHNPSHIYDSSGTFTVELRVWTASSFRLVTKEKYILVTSQNKVDTPTLSPSPGSYTGPQNIVITCMTPGATIYYTINGSDPMKDASAIYVSPIRIDDTTIVKARAYRNGLEPSDIVSGTYYIGRIEGLELWHFTSGRKIDSSPAIGKDGTIYVGSDDQRLYAISQNGQKKWSFAIDAAITSSPSVGQDGTIYVGSWNNKVYAVNPDGTKRWEFLTGRYVESSPAIGQDGTIYVGSNDDSLYAINPDGSEKWAFHAGSLYSCSPAIGRDGTIYVGSQYGWNFYALNPDGTVRWKYQVEESLSNSPAIGQDGTVYVVADHLFALNPDGSKKWVSNESSGIRSSPAISQDGTIYVGGLSELYALNPDGTKRWAFYTGSVVGTPAIGQDGTVYVGCCDKRLYALNPDGTKRWAFYTGGLVISSPAIGQDGTVYVGSQDNNLYAICSGSKRLSPGPWPKFMQNNQNTGLFGGSPNSLDINHNSYLVKDFDLIQNYPNPFNPSTTIQFALAVRSHVALAVYNVLGQLVREIVNEQKESGYYRVPFNADGLASGVYFYRLKAGRFVETRKMVVLR